MVAFTPAFNEYRRGNSAIQRLWTGALRAEGPAWNAVGRYLLWSDIPNNIQLRRLEDDGHVSIFRNPSGNGSIRFTDPPYGTAPIGGRPCRSA